MALDTSCFWLRLEREFYKQGGKKEDLVRLSKEKSNPAIRVFARQIIQGIYQAYQVVGNFSSMREAIDAGSLKVWGLEDNVFLWDSWHPVDTLVELAHFNKLVDVRSLILERHNFVDFPTLLAFAAQFPKMQEEFPIATLWDVGGRILSAEISKNGGRYLFVSPRDGNEGFLAKYRFLVYK